jgi:hypothetical protein
MKALVKVSLGLAIVLGLIVALSGFGNSSPDSQLESWKNEKTPVAIFFAISGSSGFKCTIVEISSGALAVMPADGNSATDIVYINRSQVALIRGA